MLLDEIYGKYFDEHFCSLPLPDDWQDGAAYIRVSTDKQEELSPDGQLRVILDYASAHRIRIKKEFIFIENGISGRQAKKRPEFQRMIGIAKQSPAPFQVLLLWKFSRFARNQEESIVYKSMLKKQCGIDVVSTSEPLIDGPFGSLIERIIEWMDEYYSINLSGEVTRGMSEKARRGGYQCTPPLGYRSPGPGLPFVSDPESAPIVQMIFQLYNNGYEPTSIARQLNEIGYKTRRGNVFERRNIVYILHNKFYIGSLSWNGIEVEGSHELIISRDEFEKAQARLASSYAPLRRRGTAYAKHWLSGLLKCSACGATLTYGGHEKHKSWQCWKYAKGMHPGSHTLSIRKSETAVIAYLESLLDGAEFNYTYYPPDLPSSPDLDKYQSDLKRLDLREARVRMAYENGIDSIEEYKENRSRINSEREQVKKLIEAAQFVPEKEKPKKEDLLDRIQTAVDLLKDNQVDNEMKGSFLRTFIEKIVYDKSTEHMTFYFYLK